MPIDTKTPEYKKFEPIWQKCRDAIAGEAAVKEKGTEYLPMIGDPQNKACRLKYTAYKKRALWHGYTERVLEGLIGYIFRKEPQITIPENKEHLLEEITINRTSLDDFLAEAVDEVLSVGRYGILVDIPEEGVRVPALVGYNTESIINYRYEKIDGLHKLTLVVLEEHLQVPSPEDPYEMEDKTQFLELRLIDGIYIARYWEIKDEEPVVTDTIIPDAKGEYLNEIPFVILSPNISKRRIQKPPILDVVEANYSHYRSSADLENARHWYGNPTLWGAGIQNSEDIVVGSPVAQLFKNPQAKLELLEMKSGVAPLENALEEKRQLIIVRGARLLEEQKKAVEATETHKERRIGETSALAKLAKSISKQLTAVLKIWFEWAGGNPDQISVVLNTDYTPDAIEPEMLRELRELKLANMISAKVFYHYLDSLEFYPDQWSFETEQDEIEMEGPV